MSDCVSDASFKVQSRRDFIKSSVGASAIALADFHYPPKPEECSFDMEPPVKPGRDGLYPVPIPGVTKLI